MEMCNPNNRIATDELIYVKARLRYLANALGVEDVMLNASRCLANETNAMKRSKRKTKTKRREPPEVNHATSGKIHERRRLLPIWSVQHLPDSTQAFFNTKRECWSGSNVGKRTSCRYSPRSAYGSLMLAVLTSALVLDH
jgi:hypothetical protein